jgi:hypothetical protein
MIEVNRKRPVSSQTFSFRPYEDSYAEVMSICEASGRNPTDELRDLIDEGLRLRHFPTAANSGLNEVLEALQQITQITSEHTNMIARIARNLREQSVMTAEALEAAYCARHLTWKYLAEPALHKEGLTSEDIRHRHIEETETCNDERLKMMRTIQELLEDFDD